MGFGETTWITCRDCGKVFGCGCVIQAACPECIAKDCDHVWRHFETGPSVCLKCFGLAPAPVPKAASQES